MFVNSSHLLADNPSQLNYGVAIADLTGAGTLSAIVAGFGSENLVLQWTGEGLENVADGVLADEASAAIGIAAADWDGDGREEIYILNSDSFAGHKGGGDRLFDWLDGEWVDLLALAQNRAAQNRMAGRSVVAIDRLGTGRYGFFAASYGGPMRLYELSADGTIVDVASAVGLAQTTGGRGAIALPLLGSDRLDLFTVNENGPNFLFLNNQGTFAEMAEGTGLSDPLGHGRGVAAIDPLGSGRFGLVWGNWEGEHHLVAQPQPGQFVEITPPELAVPSRVRTVIVADFDNDGYEEIFFNNIGQPNRLFGWRNGAWQALDLGEATEPYGLGTGAAAADLDGDGCLELLIAHGESAAQPLTLYRPDANGNHWLRIAPLTRYGAPARGAVVELRRGDRRQLRVIDGGSGYLCQMEPIAHFGLGEEATPPEQVIVRWPDGSRRELFPQAVDQVLRVPHPEGRSLSLAP